MILYDDEMSWGHGDGYVILRAPMDGSVIEVVYRETMIHSTEVVWEILARKKWLGCYHDTSPIVDIPGSTPLSALYMIFFWFSWYKIYMYYVFKSICIIKKNIGGLWLRLGPMMFREGFRPPTSFKEKKIHRYIVV